MKSPFLKGNQRKRRETKIDSVCLTSLEQKICFSSSSRAGWYKGIYIKESVWKIHFYKVSGKIKAGHKYHVHAVRLGQVGDLGLQSSQEDI